MAIDNDVANAGLAGAVKCAQPQPKYYVVSLAPQKVCCLFITNTIFCLFLLSFGFRCFLHAASGLTSFGFFFLHHFFYFNCMFFFFLFYSLITLILSVKIILFCIVGVLFSFFYPLNNFISSVLVVYFNILTGTIELLAWISYFYIIKKKEKTVIVKLLYGPTL